MRVSIIGLGLIGGSLGLALKKANWKASKITGYVRRHEIGRLALEIGAVDRIALTIEDAVSDSDLVFIATPVLAVRDIFLQISPYLSQDCIVTDVASTKVEVMNWAEEILPPGIIFIGGHPMAGKDTSGMVSAETDLFIDCTYCLVCGPQTTPDAEETLIDMIKTIGANTMKIDAREHDDMVAGISHLPFLLSVALVETTTGQTDWPKMSQLASTGYRDATRLASGSPDVNAQICLTNSAAILHWIGLFQEELKRLENLISKEDKEIIDVLSSAKKAREKWQANHHQ